MFTDRRSFLIGAGSLISTSFIGRATDFIERTGRPFLLAPRTTAETLFVNYCEEQISFSLGWADVPEPEPPSWAEFLKAEGYKLDTDASLSETLENWELSRDDLSKPMDEFTWWTAWESRYGPCARAFRLLVKTELSPLGAHGRPIGGLNFIEGVRPGSSDTWVEAEDQLTVSLVQARLRELNAPIEVRLGMNN